MNNKKMVRVANAQGFWGDSLLGPIRLVEEGPVDYLTFDYLAEITMSIMQKQKMRNPEAGYALDFITMLARILPTCQQKGIKVIANAAGVNPKACLQAIEKVITDLGLTGIRVGIVEGDDILDTLPELIKSGELFNNLETGDNLDQIRDRISSANVYIGAKPIADALDQGADIVITGRASDPSLVLAPLIHEFGWSMEDYDRMAAGTIMGHIIECGPQCTGGNFTHWRDVPDMARIGYPIIEASDDGSFVVTKHENTGGLVSVETVTSQLLYELGDPKNYLGPDCIADFTSIEIAQEDTNRVSISGIKGYAPTPTYKVSMSYSSGYKILSTLCIAGPDAIEKAHVLADMVFERMAMHGAVIAEEDRFLELFGTNVLYKGLVPAAEQPHEIMMRVGAKGDNRDQLNILGAEIAPLLTSGPPGITGFAGGRARATEVVGYWPALIDKTKVSTQVTVKEI
ncbi:acyclic terpene utilization AtuA family protein [Oceanicoccus sp. KOV_DT_Chl]|uniref:acyclic terpene utilization AtuA family protein n=1 Tax=Oceanicoccus sp. KOV_DT_Chl TaxID=1904639 RepID=UPI000C7AD6AF|nr:acyclic terpene utilization AtuA family protein [Oceanicoccus sp. KOV_DT_Chl]